MMRKIVLGVALSFALFTYQSAEAGKKDTLKKVKQEMSDRAADRILTLSNLSDASKKERKPLVANICLQAFMVENKQMLDKQASEGEDKFENINVAERMMFAEFIDYWTEQSEKSVKKKKKRELFKEKALQGLAYEYEGKTADKKNFTITMRCMDISTASGWMPEALKRGRM